MKPDKKQFLTILFEERFREGAQPAPRLASYLRGISRASSITGVLIGSLVLIGWIFDLDILKSGLPGLAAMKANTASAFIVAGISLWLLHTERKAERALLAALGGALIVTLIALLTLGEYLFDRNLGIDRLLFDDSAGGAGTNLPGRMAPATAFNFLLIGVALTLLAAHWARRLADALVVTAALISLLAIIGYAYGAETLYRIAPYNSMAANTSLVFFALCTGCLLVRPEQGVARIIANNSLGGVMARRLLPASMLVPPVLGWLRLEGERAGLYGFEFGLSLFAVSNIIVFSILVWWNAGLLSEADAALRKANKELLEARDGLEARVMERTAELGKINEALHATTVNRTQVEEALRDSEERFRRIFEDAPIAMAMADLNYRLISVNTAFRKMLGYTPEEVSALTFLDITHPEDDERDLHMVGRMFKGETMTYRSEKRYFKKSGETVWAYLTATAIRGQDGNVLYGLGMIEDITERKHAETQIRESLKEKEILLKEIHHRVKNNLQVISSLLRLQSRHIQDQHAVELLEESQDRVHSMALVHEKLYQADTLSNIDFADYVRDLANGLLHSYNAGSNTITLNTHVDNIFLEINTAVPCGLIINELVSNAIKHAFPNARPGKIDVDFHYDDCGKFRLSVSDTGIGLPANLSIDAADTMGFTVVRVLINQLQGTVETSNNGGTQFDIRFASSMRHAGG